MCVQFSCFDFIVGLVNWILHHAIMQLRNMLTCFLLKVLFDLKNQFTEAHGFQDDGFTSSFYEK